MSVDGYLNRAISNLERTVSAKHREVSDARSQIIREDRKTRKQVDKLERKLVNQEADLALIDHGAGEAALDMRQIKQFKDEIKQEQGDYDEFKKEQEEQIKKGEELIRDLERYINELKMLDA